ncbi:MAG TPA: DUF1501 domain-containing protein [Gemmataceae bacterium]|jgi:hypothetical protein|nr:DUF1501 domain-containing protein [Gemmataceae bacterium]
MNSHVFSRRDVLRAGSLGLLGLSLPRLLAAKEKPAAAHPARAKAVIFLHQWGGPGQHETFDMKPNAPEEVRNIFKPVPTSAAGIQICELLPRTAKVMNKVCLVRSVQHTMKNHNSAGYYSLTGHAPPTDDQRLRDSSDLLPAYGSVVDHFATNTNGLPTFVAFPHVIRDGSVTPGQHASFLGKVHNPLLITQDPNSAGFGLPELSLPANLTPERLSNRREMLDLIDRQSQLLEHSAMAQGIDQSYQKALAMLTSPKVKQAFDLSAEPTKVREQYGRTTYGQSCLLARRLVETGVKFVNVYFSDVIGGDTGGWDTHGFDKKPMNPILKNYLLPITDQTLPTLLNDLDERGLLASTLVVWMGEFGRTPKINATAGRDHWPQCYTVLLAGGGVKRGFVYGISDKIGAYPQQDPVRLDDLAATIFELLGIDPATEIRDPLNRPVPIAAGQTIQAIMA